MIQKVSFQFVLLFGMVGNDNRWSNELNKTTIDFLLNFFIARDDLFVCLVLLNRTEIDFCFVLHWVFIFILQQDS